MTANLTHGFDLVEQIAESTINTLVGVAGALPTDLDLPFDAVTLTGTRATGTATFYLIPPDMTSGSVRLDGFVEDSVLLDLSFYYASIELEAPAHCSITNLVGRILVSGIIDMITPPAHPDHRYLALTMFLPCSVILEGGTEEHINDTLQDCGIPLSAGDLLPILGQAIDDALAAILAVDGYLGLHDHPIPVSPGSTDPFEPQEIDVRVVNEVGPDPAWEQDALALLVTTLGDRGDRTRFGSTSFLRPHEGGALAIGNFFYLRHIVRPEIIAALRVPAAEVTSHFDPGHPCRLSRRWRRETIPFDVRVGITHSSGEIRIDLDSLEVSPTDHDYFTVDATVDVDFRFRIERRWWRVGWVNGTLDGELYLDLVGNLIRPRLERTTDVRGGVDRRAKAAIRALLFWLGAWGTLAAFEAAVSHVEDRARDMARDYLHDVLDHLDAHLSPIDVRPLFDWLRPYGFEFTPAALTVDDILISGTLRRGRAAVRPAREGYGIELPTGWGFDLDWGESRETGTVDPRVVLDFGWDRSGGKKCIATASGASIAYLGPRVSFVDLNGDDLERLHYVEDHTIFETMLPIVPDDQPLNVQTGGIVFAIETSTSTGDRHYAKVRVHPMHQSDTDLTFDFATYD